ncbi:MAG: cytochrome P450, partial [Actinomycetota bacterium]
MTDTTEPTATTGPAGAEGDATWLPEYRSPEMEMAALGADVAPAADLAIDQINPHNPHLFRDNRWQEYFARLRAEDPVHLNEIETAGRFWSITSYEDVRAVDGDWRTFSSTNGIVLGLEVGSELQQTMAGQVTPFIAMDPPTHTDQRKTVRGISAPSSLRNLEPTIRERTIEVLDALPERETFDWVDTVSIELTTLLLATLFDFPLEDRRKLTRWSDIVFAIPEPGGVVESQTQRREELMECVAYFERLWEERRDQPGFDLVSMLAHGEATRDMPTAAHLGNLLLLIVGGNDTTRNTMSGSVYGLNRFGDQYDKLIADPGLITSFVPEVLRWQTPLSYMRRTATQDCEIGGKQIRKDDQVLMWYVSANHDEDVFPDAETLDIERPNADRHLSFGYGIHYCMGSRLAEMQLRILWEEALQRFERIELQDEPERTFSSFVKGYTHMPVQIT